MSIGQKRQLETKKTYWGGVDCVRASTGLALKSIFMNPDTQSSLEFHLLKHEIYWVQYGTLRLELRDGRARGADTHVILKQGDCYEIPPGVMHRRVALTAVHIVEACSVDSDEDTYIVEDGMKNETLSGLSKSEGHQ
jgi:mannose-6-phosphate isomerase-like protein (cupin superfamily)